MTAVMMKGLGSVSLAVALFFGASGCGLLQDIPEPCSEDFVIYEQGGQWYTERVDNGTVIFGPGTQAEATEVCVNS